MSPTQPRRWYRSWPGIVFLVVIVLGLGGLAYTLSTQEPEDGVVTPEETYPDPAATE